MYRYIILIGLLLLLGCQNEKNVQAENVMEQADYQFVGLDTLFQAFDMRAQETSGLMKIGDTYWTNNDSGGEANLYQIDMTTGKIVRTVEIEGVKNIDWEELAYDSTHFYIGNFGNNLGKREDLEIYKGEISSLINSDKVAVEKIKFSYPDQTKFYNGYNHNHDCEAMIIYQNEIVLFSKNWGDLRCKMYTLPNAAGTYKAELHSDFNSDGVITAADISSDNQKLILLGYSGSPQSGFEPFVWKITDWEGSDLLSGKKSRYNFHVRRQMEGIIFDNSQSLIISSEDENGSAPSLYRMNI